MSGMLSYVPEYQECDINEGHRARGGVSMPNSETGDGSYSRSCTKGLSVPGFFVFMPSSAHRCAHPGLTISHRCAEQGVLTHRCAEQGGLTHRCAHPGNNCHRCAHPGNNCHRCAQGEVLISPLCTGRGTNLTVVHTEVHPCTH